MHHLNSQPNNKIKRHESRFHPMEQISASSAFQKLPTAALPGAQLPQPAYITTLLHKKPLPSQGGHLQQSPGAGDSSVWRGAESADGGVTVPPSTQQSAQKGQCLLPSHAG